MGDRKIAAFSGFLPGFFSQPQSPDSRLPFSRRMRIYKCRSSEGGHEKTAGALKDIHKAAGKEEIHHEPADD